MQITRREFCQSTAAVALATAVLGVSTLPPFQGLALAQTVPIAELMQPGSLPEMIMGADNAPVIIVEYASMTCSHCANFQENTFPELKKRYIDTGKVRYIFREFPLDALALDASLLARCIGKDDKNKYFTLIDALFAQQRQWALPDPSRKPHPALRNSALLAIAKQVGFTEKTYNECVTNQQIMDGVGNGLERAVKQFKVQSTPTFFINGTQHAGALSIEEMSKLIDPYLKGG